MMTNWQQGYQTVGYHSDQRTLTGNNYWVVAKTF